MRYEMMPPETGVWEEKEPVAEIRGMLTVVDEVALRSESQWTYWRKAKLCPTCGQVKP